MAVIIAKGQKTITGLQDGYSIIATPATIVIPSNADGSNPILSGAKSRVLLQNSQGVNMTVNITSVVSTGCTATYSGNELTITSVSADTGNLAVTFNSTSGYVGSINIPFAKLKQGESTYNVLLSNEAHAIPALYDGRVDQTAIDLAVSKIVVLKGTTPLTPVAANATPGVGQFRYNVDTVVGGTAVRVDNNTFKLATITASTCVIKVKVYLESLSRAVDKEMVITKVVGGNPDDFDQLKSVFDGWRFADTNEIDGNKIKSGTISVDKLITLDLIARQFATDNLPSALTINKGGNGLFILPYANGVPAIKIGLIGGKPQIIFYDESGAQTWSQDKSGIIYVDFVAASWVTDELTFLTAQFPPNDPYDIDPLIQANLRNFITDNWFLTDNPYGYPTSSDPSKTDRWIKSGVDKHFYSPGKNPDSSLNEKYKGYHDDRVLSLSNFTADGWYGSAKVMCRSEYDYQIQQYKYAVPLMYMKNGIMTVYTTISDVISY